MPQDYSKILREQVFPRVQKPSRYIGGEWNMVRKDPAQVRARVALAFPDVYEIGVSYLGYQILYELLNNLPDVYAERVYSPWPDMEKILRELDLPLCSLETSSALAEFDIIGITLQHELSYTNVLNLLDLSHVPLTRDGRGESHPLILAGGPCASNPEPMAEVFDAIVLGDGETIFPGVIRRYRDLKEQGLGRRERIRELAKLPGVYVPGLYRPVYAAAEAAAGDLIRVDPEPGAPFPVRRNHEASPGLPLKPLVPYLGVTHDRVSAELFRGCVRGCRFCQAGMITRPVRERDPQTVLDQLLAELKETGYEEASLTSLSSGDYTQLLPLVRALMADFSPRRVALSFPSLRLDSFQKELAETVREVRKTGLTFAPEAGSVRLRQVINKGLEEEQFIQSLGQVFAGGWDMVKLYFMVGLPTETREDIAAINQLVRRILAQARNGRQGGRRSPHVHLGVGLFVPKAHTPFQWEGQLPRDEAAARMEQLARELPRAAGFEFNRQREEDLNRSYLEGVLARGDRRLWPVILKAWQLGARFDSWGEEFRFAFWQQAFRETGIDPDSYALRERGLEECLPWSHLDMGVSTDYLLQERERSRAGTPTPDCRGESGCNACGMTDPQGCPPPPAAVLPPASQPAKLVTRPERELIRIRLRYRKTGDLRFVGHLDLVNLFRRAARRADLPLHYSLGFHPQPSLSFGPPLPLGYLGLGEWLDMGLDRWQEPKEVVRLLNEYLPLAGVAVEAGREVPLTTPALNERIQAGEYLLEFPTQAGSQAWETRVQAFLSATEVKGTQWSKRGLVSVNLRPSVNALQLGTVDGKTAQLKLLHDTSVAGAAKVPALVEHFCEQGPEAAWAVRVTRVASGMLYNNTITIP